MRDLSEKKENGFNQSLQTPVRNQTISEQKFPKKIKANQPGQSDQTAGYVQQSRPPETQTRQGPQITKEKTSQKTLKIKDLPTPPDVRQEYCR